VTDLVLLIYPHLPLGSLQRSSVGVLGKSDGHPHKAYVYIFIANEILNVHSHVLLYM